MPGICGRASRRICQLPDAGGHRQLRPYSDGYLHSAVGQFLSTVAGDPRDELPGCLRWPRMTTNSTTTSASSAWNSKENPPNRTKKSPSPPLWEMAGMFRRNNRE
jgi:hypothetical protein